MRLEILTYGAESRRRNPRNPPEKTRAGRGEGALECAQKSQTLLLLAELGEPCLSQPQPPGPVPFTSQLSSSTLTNASSSYILAFSLAEAWPMSGAPWRVLLSLLPPLQTLPCSLRQAGRPVFRACVDPDPSVARCSGQESFLWLCSFL